MCNAKSIHPWDGPVGHFVGFVRFLISYLSVVNFFVINKIPQMDVQSMLFSSMKRAILIFSFKKLYGYKKN
jgi:hypothetical protein